MSRRETSKPGAATWRGQACTQELPGIRAACLPAAGAVERDTTLRGSLSNRRGRADARHHRPGKRIRAIRLPADHGAVARSRLACGQGSSAADLAARGAESAAKTKAPGKVMAERRILHSAT